MQRKETEEKNGTVFVVEGEGMKKYSRKWMDKNDSYCREKQQM